jgi:hypothetical protein
VLAPLTFEAGGVRVEYHALVRQLLLLRRLPPPPAPAAAAAAAAGDEDAGEDHRRRDGGGDDLRREPPRPVPRSRGLAAAAVGRQAPRGVRRRGETEHRRWCRGRRRRRGGCRRRGRAIGRHGADRSISERRAILVIPLSAAADNLLEESDDERGTNCNLHSESVPIKFDKAMVFLRVGCIITKSDRCAEKMTNEVGAKAKARQLASAPAGSAEPATVASSRSALRREEEAARGATGSAAARPRLGSGPPRGRPASQPAAPDASGHHLHACYSCTASQE